MANYYETWPMTTPLQTNAVGHGEAPQAYVLLEYNKLHETLLSDNAEEGWASKLWHYLGTMQ
jgi:hypothetical protein